MKPGISEQGLRRIARKVLGGNLLSVLESLSPLFAQKAQESYDAWQQDDEGFDEVLGAGGICDEVADEISSVLSENNIDTMDGGAEGDDHAWVIAYTDEEAYGIDIPPGVYERGAGYSWKKIKDIQITEEDVAIFEIDRSDLGDPDDDY